MNESEINQRFEVIEKRLSLLEGKSKNIISKTIKNENWYKEGSTIHKILILDKENFFRVPKTISGMIQEFKSKDYHLRASDLTLPLRKIVRKGILKKTKKNADGSESKNWRYIRK